MGEVRTSVQRTTSFLQLQVPAVPVLVITVLAFLALAFEPGGTNWRSVATATLVALAILLFAQLVPWERLPRAVQLTLPLGMLLVIALLRDAQGGGKSGYGPLVMLPVIWVALTLRRREVIVAAIATGLFFGLPILIEGSPRYPANGWRGTLLWTLVALLVGLIVHAVVEEQRRQAAIADDRARELENLKTVFQSIAQMARRVSASAEARDLICSVALEAVGAALVTIVEPLPEGGFETTGSAGMHMDDVTVDLLGPNTTAFFSGEPVFIPDIGEQAGASSSGAARSTLASVLCEPIRNGEKTVGVLCIGWAERHEEPDAQQSSISSDLAAEAAAMIERADLVDHLDDLAHTDQLTGIGNRRFWDEQLERAAGDASAAPFCVAMIDLDHFKEFNDVHGHPSGDALLEEAASAWRSQLRARDLLARLGGEEFAVLLPECSVADAEPVMERVRTATPRGVTCSVGLAERAPGENNRDLTARADAALYRAKAAGRDRLSIA